MLTKYMSIMCDGGDYFIHLYLMILHDARDHTTGVMQCTMHIIYTNTLLCFGCITNTL